jgi:hypothetical protein
MQAMVVMLIALGGLGCQNPEEKVPVPPPIAVPVPESAPVAEQPAAPSSETAPAYAPAPYPLPSYYGGPYPYDAPDDDSFGACLRDTLYSFVYGRSPGVPSVREIESAYRAGLYNH